MSDEGLGSDSLKRSTINPWWIRVFQIGRALATDGPTGLGRPQCMTALSSVVRQGALRGLRLAIGQGMEVVYPGTVQATESSISVILGTVPEDPSLTRIPLVLLRVATEMAHVPETAMSITQRLSDSETR